MTKDKYSKKINLTPVEISMVSISLRKSLREAKKEKVEDTKEYIKQVGKLQKKFQRLAVKIEKKVLADIKQIQNKF